MCPTNLVQRNRHYEIYRRTGACYRKLRCKSYFVSNEPDECVIFHKEILLCWDPLPGTEVLAAAVSSVWLSISNLRQFCFSKEDLEQRQEEGRDALVNCLPEYSSMRSACASPTTRLVLRISGTRHQGEPIATPNIISVYKGYPFSQHLLLAWVIHSICLESLISSGRIQIQIQ